MNLVCVFARRGPNWEALLLPGKAALGAVLKSFYEMTHDEAFQKRFDEVQVWSSSGGCLKKRVFNPLPTEAQRVRTAAELVASDKENQVGKFAPGAKAEPSDEAAQDAPAAKSVKKVTKGDKPAKPAAPAKTAAVAPSGDELLK